MLEQLQCKDKEFTLWPIIFFIFILLYSNEVLSSDLKDQTTIIDTYFEVDSEDRGLAESLAKQARQRASSVGDSNLGPLIKLWCDAAVIAPDPDNLAECARLRFEAVDYMSNPQPSKGAVRMQRARDSLIMIRAALEIAGGDPNVSRALRHCLRNYFECFRSVISESGKITNCK